jgi:hypothetical protein
VSKTCCFRNVRRSCEAFAMATLQNDPWHENPFPDTTDLGQQLFGYILEVGFLEARMIVLILVLAEQFGF